VRVWRIAAVAHAAFDGEGSRRHGSCWTPRGIPAVFASATLSLAALERFVHTDSDLEPTDLLAIPVEIHDDIAIEAVAVETLPADWRTFPAPPALTLIGEQWFRSSRTAVLSVPSVVIPHERNSVLNPTHRAFAQIVIGRSESFSFDPECGRGDALRSAQYRAVVR
jgi:RES domain-containing protein